MLFYAVLAEQNPWWLLPGSPQALEYPARRDFHERLYSHAQSDDRRALVVLGPRQVGKTVALKQLVDRLRDAGWPPGNLTYFDFSDDRLVHPASPREVAGFEPPGVLPDKPRLLLLDEINRAPRWQGWLKQMVDSNRSLRVIATGSIAGALRAGARESGQGRWDELRVAGLTYTEHLRFRAAIVGVSQGEVRRRFPNELQRYLALGGFPEHVSTDDLARARARIREDIADRAIARDLAESGVDVEGVRRLFAYLAAQSGAVFSARERARDLEVDERSIKSWLEHLSDAQLIGRLEQHTRGAARLRTKPKIYAADHGMVAAFAASPDRRHDSEILARIVETVVFRHLRDPSGTAIDRLRYFRTDLHLEGDFVIAGDRKPLVVEVTSSTVVKPEKIRRVREVGEALRTSALFVVHLGIQTEEREGVRCVPLETFLLHPPMLEQRDV
ncbi:MAG: ATP-binding protein [Thermodesulfobacteriota bacterium]